MEIPVQADGEIVLFASVDAMAIQINGRVPGRKFPGSPPAMEDIPLRSDAGENATGHLVFSMFASQKETAVHIVSPEVRVSLGVHKSAKKFPLERKWPQDPCELSVDQI